MNNVLKYCLFILGSLVLLLVLAVVLVAVFVDPNDYKDQLSRVVQEKTGRELTFQGDISLTFFPWLGVKVDGLALGNAPGFGDKPFLSVGSAQAGLKVLPLFSGNVEIGTVTLDKVRLHLTKDAQGHSNWEDLGGGAGATEPTASDAESAEAARPDQGNGEVADGLALRLGGVVLQDADVVYDDRQAGKRYEVHKLSLTLGAIQRDEPFPFELSSVFDSEAPEAAGSVSVQGVAALDFAGQRYAVSDLNVTLSAKGAAVPGGQADVTGQASRLRADLKSQTASVEGLELSAYGLKAHGTVQVAKLLTAPEVLGVLEVPAFDLKKTLTALGQRAPETTDPAAMTRVAARVEVNYSPAGIKADGVHLDLDGQGLDASFAMTGTAVPAYRFTARADSLDLDPYLPPRQAEAAGMDSGDGSAAEPAAAPRPSALAETLRKLELDGSLQVGRLKVSGIELTDLDIPLSAHGGVLRAAPVGLAFFGGTFQADYGMDARPDVPVSTLNLRLAGVEIGQILQTVVGKPYVSGTLHAASTGPLTFSGLDPQTILGSLTGRFELQAVNGVLAAGSTAARVLDVVSTVLLATGTVMRGDAIAFDSLDVMASLGNGVLQNGLVLLKSPMLWAKGGGAIDLVARTLDYDVGAKLVNHADPQQSYDQLVAPEVEVALTGSLSEPDIKTNLLKSVGKVVTGTMGDILKGVGQNTGNAAEDPGKGVRKLGKKLGLPF